MPHFSSAVTYESLGLTFRSGATQQVETTSVLIYPVIRRAGCLRPDSALPPAPAQYDGQVPTTSTRPQHKTHRQSRAARRRRRLQQCTAPATASLLTCFLPPLPARSPAPPPKSPAAESTTRVRPSATLRRRARSESVKSCSRPSSW